MAKRSRKSRPRSPSTLSASGRLAPAYFEIWDELADDAEIAEHDLSLPDVGLGQHVAPPEIKQGPLTDQRFAEDQTGGHVEDDVQPD